MSTYQDVFAPDLTADPLTIAEEIQYIIEDARDMQKLGVVDIFFGDQANMPHSPTVCVEPGPVRSEYQGAPFVTNNELTVYIMLYHSKVSLPAGSLQDAAKESISLAQQIRDLLHEDKTIKGRVLHGFVTNLEPGYATRGGSLWRSTRITWQGMSKVSI